MFSTSVRPADRVRSLLQETARMPAYGPRIRCARRSGLRACGCRGSCRPSRSQCQPSLAQSRQQERPVRLQSAAWRATTSPSPEQSAPREEKRLRSGSVAGDTIPVDAGDALVLRVEGQTIVHVSAGSAGDSSSRSSSTTITLPWAADYLVDTVDDRAGQAEVAFALHDLHGCETAYGAHQLPYLLPRTTKPAGSRGPSLKTYSGVRSASGFAAASSIVCRV